MAAYRNLVFIVLRFLIISSKQISYNLVIIALSVLINIHEVVSYFFYLINDNESFFFYQISLFTILRSFNEFISFINCFKR